MIVLPIPTTSRTDLSLKGWENVLLNLGVKGLQLNPYSMTEIGLDCTEPKSLQRCYLLVNETFSMLDRRG